MPQQHLLSLLFLSFICASLCHSVPVNTADDLINLFQNASGDTLKTDIIVIADLDFSASNLTLPLGAFSNGTCVAFSGLFQGNGHSINGLTMNNTFLQGYKHAGLFCSLKDAIVENLVIDASCSFVGYNAGALSVSVSGSLTATHIINKAAVNGKSGVGGFIGFINNMKQQQADILFEDCVNDGIVCEDLGSAGGFIGRISNSGGMTAHFLNSLNNGNVTGAANNAGGFVGFVSYHNATALTISNSSNSGTVTSSLRGGGFVGWISGQVISVTMAMAIVNSTNNGIVIGSGDNHVGGFVGVTYGGMVMIISNSTNNGNITGRSQYVGGFVGYICPH